MEQNLNDVPFPDRLVKFNPGYLASDLSAIFNIDYEGASGVTKDVQLTYPLESVIRGTAEPAPTFQITSTDAVQSFTPAQLLVGTRSARAMLITVQNNPIHFSFVSDPDQADAGHALGPATTPSFILLEGIQLLQQFNFISASLGVHGVLNCSPRT